jgi:hypothetical protein
MYNILIIKIINLYIKMDETIDNKGIDEDNDETNDKTIDEDNKDKDNKNESKDKTNDLSILLKSFNRLDNYIARYIYKKYIAQDSSFLEKQDSSFLEKSRAKKQDSSFLEKSRAKKQDLENPARKSGELEGLKPSHKHTEIKIENFLKTIFNIERPGIITQKESLETDLYKMDIADKAYDKDPKKFKLRQYESVPDIKRCSFIRKHKNKYKRCNIHVMNDDSDICYKHIDSPNIYWDRYCEVLDEIKNIEV